jgi:chromosomal replication initiator protein
MIAHSVESNIRELEGVLLKVKMMQDLEGKLVNKKDVLDHFRDFAVEDERKVSIDSIIHTIAKKYNVTYGDIVGQKRKSAISNARQIAMFLTRELTDLSLQTVGDCFGGRDYSTVIHARDKIRLKMEKDESFREEIENLINVLKFKN